jgi:hypothetical protein
MINRFTNVQKQSRLHGLEIFHEDVQLFTETHGTFSLTIQVDP